MLIEFSSESRSVGSVEEDIAGSDDVSCVLSDDVAFFC